MPSFNDMRSLSLIIRGVRCPGRWRIRVVGPRFQRGALVGFCCGFTPRRGDSRATSSLTKPVANG